jgi:cyclopropane-fatty-acyl-phospholipid synthase
MKTKYTLSKHFILKLCEHIKSGSLSIIDHEGTYHFEQASTAIEKKAALSVNNQQFYHKVLLAGTNGAAESYILADWDVNNLVHLIELIIANEKIFQKIDSGFSYLSNAINKLLHFFKSNNKTNAKLNILKHYDLGNEFFQTFLDPTMMYSSAVFNHANETLETASLNKLRIICEKLELNSNDHLLEIGTGWGGMAIFAATEYGCRVTTTTISDKQYAYVANKIQELNLQDKITLLHRDYRDLTGEYDKLVSIEMIEAVGHQYFDTFFKKCHSLVKDNGYLFLQAIVINDQAYEQAKNSIDFIKKYIFPGGCLPSIHAISQSISTHTRFQLTYLNDIGHHYSKTLDYWMQSFNNQLDRVRELGFSEEFIRMWNFYFAYCIAGFNQHYISDIHALWRKRV